MMTWAKKAASSVAVVATPTTAEKLVDADKNMGVMNGGGVADEKRVVNTGLTDKRVNRKKHGTTQAGNKVANVTNKEESNGHDTNGKSSGKEDVKRKILGTDEEEPEIEKEEEPEGKRMMHHHHLIKLTLSILAFVGVSIVGKFLLLVFVIRIIPYSTTVVRRLLLDFESSNYYATSSTPFWWLGLVLTVLSLGLTIHQAVTRRSQTTSNEGVVDEEINNVEANHVPTMPHKFDRVTNAFVRTFSYALLAWKKRTISEHENEDAHTRRQGDSTTTMEEDVSPAMTSEDESEIALSKSNGGSGILILFQMTAASAEDERESSELISADHDDNGESGNSGIFVLFQASIVAILINVTLIQCLSYTMARHYFRSTVEGVVFPLGVVELLPDLRDHFRALKYGSISWNNVPVAVLGLVTFLAASGIGLRSHARMIMEKMIGHRQIRSTSNRAGEKEDEVHQEGKGENPEGVSTIIESSVISPSSSSGFGIIVPCVASAIILNALAVLLVYLALSSLPVLMQTWDGYAASAAFSPELGTIALAVAVQLLVVVQWLLLRKNIRDWRSHQLEGAAEAKELSPGIELKKECGLVKKGGEEVVPTKAEVSKSPDTNTTVSVSGTPSVHSLSDGLDVATAVIDKAVSRSAVKTERGSFGGKKSGNVATPMKKEGYETPPKVMVKIDVTMAPVAEIKPCVTIEPVISTTKVTLDDTSMKEAHTESTTTAHKRKHSSSAESDADMGGMEKASNDSNVGGRETKQDVNHTQNNKRRSDDDDDPRGEHNGPNKKQRKPEELEKLLQQPIPTKLTKDQKWDYMFDLCKAYYELNESFIVPRSKNASLSYWIQQQRKQYRDILRNASGTKVLTPARIKALESIGFTFQPGRGRVSSPVPQSPILSSMGSSPSTERGVKRKGAPSPEGRSKTQKAEA